jgi:hypothetical protein
MPQGKSPAADKAMVQAGKVMARLAVKALTGPRCARSGREQLTQRLA